MGGQWTIVTVLYCPSILDFISLQSYNLCRMVQLSVDVRLDSDWLMTSGAVLILTSVQWRIFVAPETVSTIREVSPASAMKDIKQLITGQVARTSMNALISLVALESVSTLLEAMSASVNQDLLLMVFHALTWMR